MLDLRKAYLQIHVDPELWPFQRVAHKGETYSLTQLGFGFLSAPRIMSKILKTLLELDKEVEQAISHYMTLS